MVSISNGSKKSKAKISNNFGQPAINKASAAAQAQAKSPYAPAKTPKAPKAATGRTSSGGSFKVPTSIVPKTAGSNEGFANHGLTQDVLNQSAGIGTGVYLPTGTTAKKTATADAPKTFADYLTQAQSMLGAGSGGGVDTSSYDSQISGLQSNSAAADAKLAAMYNQLQGQFNGQAQGISDQYTGSGNAIKANNQQATDAVNSGYTASTNSLTNMLSKLGIGDAAVVAANNGTTLQGDQAAHVADIAQNGAASLNHNVAAGSSALDYNRGVSGAAQLAGGEARSTNEMNAAKEIATALAAKQSAVSSAASSAPSISDAASLAQTLYDNDQDSDKNVNANTLKASAAATAASKAKASAASASTSSKSREASIYAGLVKSDPDTADTIFKQMKKLGLLN